MKIAIVMTGHIRTFGITKESIKKNLLDGRDYHVFVHTWDDLGYTTVGKPVPIYDNEKREKMQQIFGCYYGTDTRSPIFNPQVFYGIENVNIISENYLELEQNLIEESLKFKNKMKTAYSINTYSQIRKQYLGFKMLEESHIKFDVVIRMRPDLFINNRFEIANNYDNCIEIPRTHNDIFAISNYDNMRTYFNLFNNLEEYNKTVTFCPHAMLEHHLRINNKKMIYSDTIEVTICK